jgi:hypothetical protein
MYEGGQGGLRANRTKALELFLLASSVRNPSISAMNAVGMYYQTGYGEHVSI